MWGPGAARGGTDSAVAAWAHTATATLRGTRDVYRVGVALIEGGGRRLQFTASDRLEAGARGVGGPGGEAVDDRVWCYIDAYDDVPLNTAVRTGGPVVGALDELADSYPVFVARQRSTGTRALAALPMLAAGQPIGAVVLFFDQPQRFDDHRVHELTCTVAGLAAELRRAQRLQARESATFADEPAPTDTVVVTFEVPQHAAAVSEARRSLRATLTEWSVGDDVTDSAVLCLSELVTNALMHTAGGCSVRILFERGVLTLAVRDGGPAVGASVQLPDEFLHVHGRGLQIVEALAQRWGSELDSVGTTVWCTFETEPSAR
jgi:anti-sigma regulatory factor (Ser/Thr protein kinase)